MPRVHNRNRDYDSRVSAEQSGVTDICWALAPGGDSQGRYSGECQWDGHRHGDSQADRWVAN